MYIANSRETTEIFLKRSIIDILREKKWNHVKCQLKTGKSEKE